MKNRNNKGTQKKELNCFSCNSWSDPRCHDPFNWTSRIEDMPPIVQCEGCCVKLVRNIGTPLLSVRRTCTDDLDINLFMVDHVCMTEGGGKGRMCFCQEDDCNAVGMLVLSGGVTGIWVLASLAVVSGDYLYGIP